MTAVVGLDLSLTATGVATYRGVRTITSKGRSEATLAQRSQRLRGLANLISAAVEDGVRGLVGGLVVIEGPSLGQARQNGQHDRAGLWWLVVERIHAMPGLQLVEVPPATRARYATGKGNAGKDEVLAAVVRRYADVEISNNNEADAWVLRAMGRDYLGDPLAPVPGTHRAALDRVAWPER